MKTLILDLRAEENSVQSWRECCLPSRVEPRRPGVPSQYGARAEDQQWLEVSVYVIRSASGAFSSRCAMEKTASISMLPKRHVDVAQRAAGKDTKRLCCWDKEKANSIDLANGSHSGDQGHVLQVQQGQKPIPRNPWWRQQDAPPHGSQRQRLPQEKESKTEVLPEQTVFKWEVLVILNWFVFHLWKKWRVENSSQFCYKETWRVTVCASHVMAV